MSRVRWSKEQKCWLGKTSFQIALLTPIWSHEHRKITIFGVHVVNLNPMPCSKKETTWKKDTRLLRGIIVHAWRVMAQFFWASDDFESWRRGDVLHRRHGGLIVPHHLVAQCMLLKENHIGCSVWMTDIPYFGKHQDEWKSWKRNIEHPLGWTVRIDVRSFLTNLGNLGIAIYLHIVAWVHLSWCLNCQFITDHVHLPTPRSEWCWLHWHVLLQVYPIPPEENSTWKTTAKT